MGNAIVTKRLLACAVLAGTIAFIQGCGTGFQGSALPRDDRRITATRSSAAIGGSAYSGGIPAVLPGTIDFDNYDVGGEGVAYHTQNRSNLGGKYRADGVGIESDGDNGNGNGYDVGWNSAGNWYKYSVNVQTSGTYPIAYRIAANSPSSMHIEDETGKNLTGAVAINSTGGFQAWATLRGTIALSGGSHVLKVLIDTPGGAGSFNLNDMEIGRSAVPASESAYPSGTPWPVPGTISFDDYDKGGEGVAYHTHRSNNPGGRYRNDGVGIELDADSGFGNGYDVGWNDLGNWYKYTVNVATAGTYAVTMRVAANGIGSLHLEDETGSDLTGSVTVTPTAGYQSWTTLKSLVTLTAGSHTLNVVIDSGSGAFNLDVMTLVTSGPPASPSPRPSASPSVAPSMSPSPGPPVGSADIDWPTQAFNSSRTGENANETKLTQATVGGLKLLWSARIAGDTTSRFSNTQPIVASRVAVGGVATDIVYAGDEHGYFTAFDGTTGSVLWRKALGSQTTTCHDIPDTRFGITDAATIDHAHNRVFTVDGAGMLWAFDLATGNVSMGWPANGLRVVDDPTLDHVYSGLSFNPTTGQLYVPSASYCDIGHWHRLCGPDTPVADLTH